MAKYITRLILTSSSYVKSNGDLDYDVLESGQIIEEASRETGIPFPEMSFSGGSSSIFVRPQFNDADAKKYPMLRHRRASNNTSQAYNSDTIYLTSGVGPVNAKWYSRTWSAKNKSSQYDTGTYSSITMEGFPILFTNNGEGTSTEVFALQYLTYLTASNNLAVSGRGDSGSPYRISASSVSWSNAPEAVWALADVRVQTLTYYRNYSSVDHTTHGTQDVVSNYDGTVKNVTPSVVNPSRDGYTFVGWATTPSGPAAYGGSTGNATIPVGVNDLSLYAIWTPNTYTVAFAANGGTGTEMSSQTFTYDQAQSLTLNSYAGPAGYGRFGGWARTPTGAAEYADGESVSNLTPISGATVTLYAVWNPNQYTVKYEGPGTESLSSDTTNCNYGDTFTLPALADLTKPVGYDQPFSWVGNGTSYSAGQSVSNLTSVDGATVTLTATWTANTYTVVFDANGGTGAMASQTFDYGTAQALTTNTITWTNHVFKGWARTVAAAQAGTVEFTNGQSVSNLSSVNGDTVTLYAVWAAKYTVAFDANGGTGTPMADQSFVVGVAQRLSANAYSQSGFVFAGWSTSAGGSVMYADQELVSDLTTVAGQTVTLYAQWIVSFAIHFDANGGTGTMQDQEGGAAAQGTLSANTFTRTGYDATKEGDNTIWNTEPDGSGTPYAAGTDLDAISSASSTLTLYAQWTALTYFVVLDSDGGGGGDFDTVGVFGSQMTYINAPTKEYFEFGGYFAERAGQGTQYYYPDGTSAHVWDIAVDYSTLYAYWISKTVSLSYDPNGGGGSVYTEQLTSGTIGSWTLAGFSTVRFTAPLNFRAYGGTWNTERDGSGTSFDPSTGDPQKTLFKGNPDGSSVSLYAIWNRIPIDVSFFLDPDDDPSDAQYYLAGIPQQLKKVSYQRPGYDLVGWNSNSTFTGDYYEAGETVTFTETDNGTGFNPEKNLYAEWEIWTLTVKYLQPGDAAIADVIVDYTHGITLPSTPTRTGYSFVEWVFNGTGYNAGVTISDTVLWGGIDGTGRTVYVTGTWTPISYAVQFDANGGTGTMDDQPFTYGVAKPLTANTFTKAGKVFAGWRQDGTGAFYADTATVGNLSDVDKDTVILYATWEDELVVTQYPQYEIPRADGAAEPAVVGEQTAEGLPIGEEVTLSENANQIVTRSYDGIQYEVHLRSFRDVMYADVSVDGMVVSLGVRCLPGIWLMPNRAVAPLGSGNFRFETDGGEYPYFTGFGTTSRLRFFTDTEIAQLEAEGK